jgi:ribosomal protein RSM22 (predicted rRNA methylase)
MDIGGLLQLIDKTFPLPGRFRAHLPADIAGLSRLLTSARTEREALYLSKPALLSAYLRYFLPWNVYRLGLVFQSISIGGRAAGPFGLKDGGAVTDLGSGPLTFAIALYLAFPELRGIKLEIRCVDRSAPALEAGVKLFNALCQSKGGEAAWKIKTVHDSLDAPVRGQKAKLVTAVNVFNELPGRGSTAEKAAALLCKLRADSGDILVVEPGVPQSGAFIAALKSALTEKGIHIAAPCVNDSPCPLISPKNRTTGLNIGLQSQKQDRLSRSGKAKWCHFARDTADAPSALLKLSEAAGLPKERAVFSYLYAVGSPAPAGGQVRIISDAFPVKEHWGRYACCEKGLALLKGRRGEIEAIPSGSLYAARDGEGEADSKSGAAVCYTQDESARRKS